MKALKIAVIPLLLLVVLSATILLTRSANISYRLLQTITGPTLPPAQTWTFDISWIDQKTHKDYIADATNARVDIIDTHTNRYVGAISGFAGYHGVKTVKGPNGLVVDQNHHLWVGDGDSTLKVIDLSSRKIVASIATGGKKRTDELAYDPQDQLIAATNGSDTVPFLSFISVTSQRVVGKIAFPESTDGLEQPFWQPDMQRFYLSIPATHAHPGGEIAVIKPATRTVEKTIPLPDGCNPTGLTSAPGHILAVGCDGHPLFLDLNTGSIDATITQMSMVDEVWYNSGDQRYYFAAGKNTKQPLVGVVDAHSLKWLTGIPVASGSRSVAVDAQDNHVFVPLSGKGIGVYSAK